MKNLINRLFGKSTNKQVEDQTTPELSTIEVPEQLSNVDISKALFTHEENSSESSQTRKKNNDFDVLIQKDHCAKGYQDGYDYQDPSYMANQKKLLICEAAEMLKEDLRELDLRILEVNRFDLDEAEMNPSIAGQLRLEREELIQKRRDLLDRVEATEEGRGAIQQVLLRYEDGFSRGFKDKRQANSLGKTFNY